MVGVGKSFNDAKGGAFAFGADVLHEFFNKAEIGDLLFVKFPDAPLM